MRITDEDLQYVRERVTKDEAINILKTFADIPNYERFITKGMGKALIDAFDLDINELRK